MKRLPIKFEDFVLKDHDILWDHEFNMCYFKNEYDKEKERLYTLNKFGVKRRILGYSVSKYEIAGIALENMANIDGSNYSLRIPGIYNGNEFGLYEEIYEEGNDKRFSVIYRNYGRDIVFPKQTKYQLNNSWELPPIKE